MINIENGTKTSHVPSLDVIRGVAVALVVIFHSGLLNSGWIGVSIFFTLSGFLITRGLLNLKSQHSKIAIYLGEFYRNRVLRIFPLYFGSILFLGGLSTVIAVPGITEGTLIYLSTFTVNFVVLLTGKPLKGVVSHFWSLAVEEQFYLIWPFLVWKLSNSRLKNVLGSIFFLSPLLRLLIVEFLPPHFDDLAKGDTVYVCTASHLDALSAGALLALAERTRELHRLSKRLALFAAGLIAAQLITVRAFWHTSLNRALDLDLPEKLIQSGSHIWLPSIIAALCGFIIGLCILNNYKSESGIYRYLRRLGKVSYSLYIIHVPVHVLTNYLLNAPSFPAGRLLILLIYAPTSYLLAEMSYKWVESPFLKLKHQGLKTGTYSERQNNPE